jgi:hypothetical protein
VIAVQPRLFGLPQQELTSDDCYTPPVVFESMGIEFDLDVCAPPGGVPWIPAKRYFTQEDDGATQPWEGRVWMNPPYSDIWPWVRRFAAHKNGVALLPCAKSKWLNFIWELADAVAVGRNGGEIVFVSPGTNKPMRIFYPIIFAAFGDECVEAIGRLGVVRRIA